MTKPYDLHASLGYQMSLASRLQERRLDDYLRPLGLARITWCVLVAVGSEGLRRPSEIADFVGIDRTATSRALRQLSDLGLVCRATGTGDRRTAEVTLSATGRDRLVQGVPLARANGRAIADKLQPGEAEQLSALLRKILAGEATSLRGL